MKFYIAFSIHGTNTFIRASKVTTDYESTEDGLLLEGVVYKKVMSRRQNVPDDRTKLHHPLLNNKDGSPTRSKTKILQVFNQLQKQGWKIEGKEYFIKKHWNIV